MPIQQLIAQVLAEIRSAWRFRWQGVAALWAVATAGLAWVVVQPDIYEASARVYVDSSSVLRPILENRIVAPDVATQLSYVRQALLGREHLERVAKENGLDANVNSGPQTEMMLDQLRSDINIDSSDSTNAVYSISYQNSDRDRAIGVVKTLLTSLVENTLGANRADTDTAERFLDERIREYENRLTQAEEARAEFKKRNADRLPGAEGGFFARMSMEREQLEAKQRELRLAQSRRDRIVAQLQSESPVITADASLDAEAAPGSLDARIRDMRLELDSKLLDYTEKHPDVINLRESLARLEQQRSEQLRALGAPDSGGDTQISTLASSPVYQSLRMAQNQVEVEIDTLQADIRERRERLSSLQALIDEVPQVEAELARLNRDYDVIYDNYQSLVRSRETQDLSRKATATEEVEFRVIDPPTAEYSPVGPPRLALLVLVFMASVGAGGGLCWLLAQMRPVFADVDGLRSIVGLPVLGSVSQAWEGQYGGRARLASIAFWSVIAALPVLFLGVVAIEVLGSGIHNFVGLT